MDTDDIAPPPRPGDSLTLAVKQDLDPYSVAELDARVLVLEAEIVRTKGKRDKAVQHRASADSIFKQLLKLCGPWTLLCFDRSSAERLD